MRQSYLKNAALMTGADVLLRLAGMGLRIYLANALGGEGMGLYQLLPTPPLPDTTPMTFLTLLLGLGALSLIHI